MKPAILLLTPSSGLGGGIERVADAVVDALQHSGALWNHMSLISKTEVEGARASHWRLYGLAKRWIASQDSDVRIVVLHRSLLPVAVMLSSQAKNSVGVTVLLHGIDVWGRHRPELLLLRHRAVRPVAVSGFTAGVVGVRTPATVMNSPINGLWYQSLVAAAKPTKDRHERLRIMTSFRLESWREKGLETVVDAVKRLDRPTQLTVCGSGQVQPGLQSLLSQLDGAELKDNLSDDELAAQFATSDLFVLATRTNRGRIPSGEGFGLVLAEAQLAGTAVVAPAFAGSSDAFIEGYSGHSPINESTDALHNVLLRMCDDDYREVIARQGHGVAVAYFHPEAQRGRILDRLLQL